MSATLPLRQGVSSVWKTIQARTRFPWFLFANIAVLLYMVPAASLFLFYVASVAVVTARDKALELIGSTRRIWLDGTAAAVITGVLLVLRDVDWLSAIGLVGAGSLKMVQGWQIATIGMSYCWLRVLYVIFASDRITGYEFTRYYFFAPSFVSGPIMAPEQYLEQTPAISWRDIQVGVARLLLGGGRYLLAMALQQVMPVTSSETMRYALEHYSPVGLWGTAFLSGVWLYLNFAAFMDIAIGASRLVGIRVPENFNNPFVATDITDFWRRWHITLGQWLRVHVFSIIARFGGKLLSPESILVGGTSALITMIVCGVWHKPTLCYVVWGTLHGLALMVHLGWTKYAPAAVKAMKDSWSYKGASWLLTHAYITITWVFFFPAGQSDWILSTAIIKRMLFI